MLRKYDLPMLIFVALQIPRSMRRRIWHYLTVLSNIEAPLNGNDLKKMGYKPGPQYKQIFTTYCRRVIIHLIHLLRLE